MVLRLIFSNVKSRKQESETYDCGRNKIPGVLETSASDSGIMRKIQEQESSRARLVVARFWNDADDSGTRIHSVGLILE